MRKLIFSMTMSLDGFIADPDGNIDWSAPDDELHRFHNEQVSQLAAYFCGRRLYEEMRYWDTAGGPGAPETEREFAEIWRALPKVVFSRTLDDVDGNARLASGDIAAEVAALREGEGDLAVGGATLAASFAALDLIDELRLFIAPVVLGGGTPYFPPGLSRRDLELAETRTFASQVVYLRCRRR